MNKAHPTQSQLDRYLNGELLESQTATIETHFFECASCRQALQVGLEVDASLQQVAAMQSPPPTCRPLWPHRIRHAHQLVRHHITPAASAVACMALIFLTLGGQKISSLAPQGTLGSPTLHPLDTNTFDQSISMNTLASFENMSLLPIEATQFHICEEQTESLMSENIKLSDSLGYSTAVSYPAEFMVCTTCGYFTPPIQRVTGFAISTKIKPTPVATMTMMP